MEIYTDYNQYMDSLWMFTKKLLRGLRWKKWCYQEGCVCDTLGGKSSETQALQWLLRHIPLFFTAQEADFPKPLLAPRTRGGHQKCCRLVDISCNNNWSPELTGTSNSQGLGGCSWLCPQEMSRGGNCKIYSKHKQLSGSQLSQVYLPHTLKG